ncbi:MAG: ABC transporter [Rhodovulum sulfidophilum]|uniref:ABC transporter n=1 Tax=Rhodovulum sulfidophilum TaxID=35806 RepID=A0A2W5NNT9_RHOSU|nr:MAG: ABC transporter [Rhodovulum sulfidophilum]
MTLLRLENLGVDLDGRAVLSEISLSIGPGEVVGLIGPNGAGKTSLMRAALGLIPRRGESSLAALDPARRARAAAFMPQGRDIAWPVTVQTLVALGRVPWLPSGARLRAEDREAVARALDRLDLTRHAGRIATHLSGGEQARALLARALAQETPLLIADEPIAGFDPAHQIATLRLFGALAAEGRSVLVAIHDLGLAARYCSRLILLREGRMIAQGPPETVLTDARLAEVFGVTAFRAETGRGLVLAPLDLDGA